MIDQSIFREYDIRGIVPTQINELSVKAIARAIAIKCNNEQVDEVALGRDGRLSGDNLLRSLSSELQSLGINVLNIGIVTSPLLYFAAKKIKSKSGIMITGSHNPKNYNGFKIVINDSPVSGIEIHNLISNELSNFKNVGSEIVKEDIMDEYINEVMSQASSDTNAMKIVLDCGNGSASEIAPKLIRSLGHQVIELFCKIDGNFPNHHPDPGKIENLQDLIKAVKSESADIGIAFDGDGDRLGVISSNGEIIYPDQLMMIFSKEVLKNNPGKEIVFDVKCTNLLSTIITDAGGIPMMSPTGHFHIKNTLKKTKAPLAGEMSGHIFFNDKWYGFDDAHYAAFRLIEIVKKSKSSFDNIVKDLPKAFSTPEMNLNVDENKKFQIVKNFIKKADFGSADKITIDGLRVNFEDGWGLLRASNTTPKLVLRFEANSSKRLNEIENMFLTQLKKIDETINIELS
ncbi:MAG: phosphomannomutase/phosphoglucomutase [SAR86 cluster bacterium]|uniref:phosphomannomutase n=1 Tax=SAR86 cluster bacterium TaxID=2030880 RepID=A0A838XY26_9GAMM|nr:phosphomannomutase/phosphoglucomutase [SAR86 cluster bacterium]|tara:strand:+ start:2864 stop:4237 length:1374 start_codon:yes stop_codon:yes gene_type:complete